MKMDQLKYRKMMISTREIFNWTQRDFARELWVNSGTISNWENGKREIPGPALKLIVMYDFMARQVQQSVFIKKQRLTLPDFIHDPQIRKQTRYGRYSLTEEQQGRLSKRPWNS